MHLSFLEKNIDNMRGGNKLNSILLTGNEL